MVIFANIFKHIPLLFCIVFLIIIWYFTDLYGFALRLLQNNIIYILEEAVMMDSCMNPYVARVSSLMSGILVTATVGPIIGINIYMTDLREMFQLSQSTGKYK